MIPSIATSFSHIVSRASRDSRNSHESISKAVKAKSLFSIGQMLMQSEYWLGA